MCFNYIGKLQGMGPTRTIQAQEGRQSLVLTNRTVKWESCEIRMQNGPFHNHILLTFLSTSCGPAKGRFASSQKVSHFKFSVVPDKALAPLPFLWLRPATLVATCFYKSHPHLVSNSVSTQTPVPSTLKMESQHNPHKHHHQPISQHAVRS